ncbi:MAG: MarR family transcriptional regulator [Saprospiraceae bacterium]|nr:MarR family transcriptional regulator [Saprospiraceae bacterium]
MAMHGDKKIGFLLERTTRIAKLSFTKAFKKLNVDITPEQWIVLDKLDLKGEMSQKEIGNESFKNAPTISRIIDNLVRKGYVSRTSEESDRRKTAISLTQEGEKVIQLCRQEVDALRDLSWNNLSDQDYEDFNRIIDQIFLNFEGYN